MILVPLVLDVFIGGLWDRYTRLVAEYQHNFKRCFEERCTCYFEHDQCEEIVSVVRTVVENNACVSVNFIAHSWGGMCAMKAAMELDKLGIGVNLLITVDPVGRKPAEALSDSITWININACPSRSNGLEGDIYASLGGKWDDWPAGKADVHYDAPFHHNEFAALLAHEPVGGSSALDRLAGPALGLLQPPINAISRFSPRP